jgi:hypothetical protein
MTDGINIGRSIAPSLSRAGPARKLFSPNLLPFPSNP